MAKRVSKTAAPAGSSKGLSAAEFMKSLGKSSGLTDLNGKVDEFYPTGNVILDRALGGGLPKGQMYVLRGKQATGKSLLALTIARTVIEGGGNVAYFDTENKISSRAIRSLGLDKYEGNQFQFLAVDTQKDAIDIVLKMIDSGIFQLAVIDSINGLSTEEQEERDIHEESKVGGYQSKTWSENLPQLKQHAARNNCAVMLTQQARDNLQSMYGPSETYSGGKAIEHFASTIIRLGSNKKGNDVVNGEVVRQGVTARIDKSNQGTYPESPIEMKFYIGDEQPWGIDELSSVFDESVRIGCLAPKKKGSSQYVPCKELCDKLDMDEKSLTFNGKARVQSAFQADDALFNAVRDIVSDVDSGNLEIHPMAASEDEVAVDFEDDSDGDDAPEE